ncbi:MAG: GWxTD domain-containing protein [candidate division Zixibacteria bacterium]|nr:GWxTD domain-containing protein [candidate division Zixibacteria bacterium]
MTGSTSAPIFNLRLSMRLLVLCVAGVLLATASLSAQSRRLAVYATSACYNNPDYDSVAVIEFPFSVNRSGLDFFRPDSTDPAFYGRVFAQVTLFDSTAMPIDSATTYFSVKVDDTVAARSTSVMLFNKLGLLVKPGLYTANLSVIDVVSKRSGDVFLKSVIASRPQKGRLEIAGPVLAHQVSRVRDSAQAADDRMVKHGFRILTNPTGTFGTNDSSCYLFAELYNLVPGSTHPKYQLQYSVLDTLGEVVQEFGFVEREKPGKTAVIIQPIDIAILPAAKYRFRVIAADPETRQADTAVVQLVRLQPREYITPASAAIASSDPFDSLSTQEKLNVTRYMLGPDQLAIVNRLSDQGKENFLEQYWREHDIEPFTPIIENRVEMVRRFQYANFHFSRLEGKKDGWESDRGRIYMVYGPQEDVLDVPAPRTGNPFSIWYYRKLKGGKFFVFEDMRGDNEFTMVHSNVDGERRSDYWDERMKDEMLDQY